MNKRLFLIIFVSVLILGAVIISFAVKRNNHSNVSNEYVYDSVDTSCYYSEKNVLYLDGSDILHLIDTDSGKDIVYCDKPNCMHEGYSYNNKKPSCPAAFFGLSKSGNVLYNGHLYFLGNMTDEDLITQYLYEMDPNGENRKKVATLRGIQDIRYVLYRDNYVIGGYVNRVVLNDAGQIINDNKPEAGIFVIDLENHKVNKGTILTGEEINITGIYYEDGFVYYTVARFKDDVSEAVLADASERDFEDFTYDNLLHDIYKYDIKNNENFLLSEIDHIHNLELHGKDVYFTTKDGYYNYNISSGETVSLDIVGNVAPKDKNRFRGFTKNGNDLYFSYLNDNNEVAYFLLRGTNLKELMRIPNESSFIMDCICGTSVYIGYYDHGDFCLGVMNINDLNNGIFNPRKLRRYNEENQ